jgi:hypothetical protein
LLHILVNEVEEHLWSCLFRLQNPQDVGDVEAGLVLTESNGAEVALKCVHQTLLVMLLLVNELVESAVGEPGLGFLLVFPYRLEKQEFGLF